MKSIKGSLGKYDPYTRSVPIVASTTNAVDGEALTTWDLSRFVKNPVILWGHDVEQLPVGLGRDVDFSPEAGLTMTVHFGSEAANPLAEQIAKCVEEGLVRALSVGYDDDDGVALLHEVSFVSVGADEDAGTPHIDPEHPDNEEVLRKRVSHAARQLALHRNRARRTIVAGGERTDAIAAFDESLRLDAGKAYVVEVHSPSDMKDVTAHVFASKKAAHEGAKALRTTNGSVYAHEASSPWRTKDAKMATAGETHAALATAHAETASAHAAAGQTRPAREHTAKSAEHGAAAAGKAGGKAPGGVISEGPGGAHSTFKSPEEVDKETVAANGAFAAAGKSGGSGDGKSNGSSNGSNGAGAGGPPSRDEAGRFDRADLPDGAVLRLDRSRLGKVDRTQVGGARVPARLSRTGVLTYVNPDGTLRRELRLEEEVFKADSLATLEHAPIIDIMDHHGLVTPDTWRNVSRGHVTQVRRDGRFIASDLIVQDSSTLEAIDAGDRTEISCGYRCRLDMTPGTHEGEPYDCVQREIRYNHVALCPPNRGRAGPEVGLRLDQQPAGDKPQWGVTTREIDEDTMTVKIRLDGREYEVGSDAHLAKVEEVHTRELDKVRTDAKTAADKSAVDLVAEKKRADEAEGRRDAAEQTLTQERADAAKTKAKADEEVAAVKKSESARILRRVKLMRMALRFFGDKGKEDEDEELDEDKMDAMSERDIMLAVIKRGAPSFDAKDKSDDYVRSRFDGLIESAQRDRGVDGIVRVARDEERRLDASDQDDDPVSKERKKRHEAHANAWKPKTTTNGGA